VILLGADPFGLCRRSIHEKNGYGDVWSLWNSSAILPYMYAGEQMFWQATRAKKSPFRHEAPERA
jgi:hypothetical protein